LGISIPTVEFPYPLTLPKSWLRSKNISTFCFKLPESWRCLNADPETIISESPKTYYEKLFPIPKFISLSESNIIKMHELFNELFEIFLRLIGKINLCANPMNSPFKLKGSNFYLKLSNLSKFNPPK
jgi:hypothetical protein